VGANPPVGELAKLAYVFHPKSFATLALFAAASELCQLLWVVDATTLDSTETRLLRRTGQVLDVAGLGLDDAAQLIASHDPAGILALADENLSVTAELAARLELPFHSPSTVARLTDKREQRGALRDAGLRAPGSWVLDGRSAEAEIGAIRAAASFPCVVKPRIGEGSRDTKIVASADELDGVIDELRADERRRSFVLEEYIPDATEPLGGEGFAGYVSVESFVADGRVSHLAVTGRTPMAYPFRETGFFIPSAISDALCREVLETATAAAHAVGVELGCLHTEIKLTPAGPTVIEVNGRIGGGVPEMLGAATGVGILQLAMRLALGDLPEFLAEPPQTDRVAYLLYVHAPAELQLVTSIDGLDDVRALRGVDEVVLRRGPGTHVDWREGNHGHVASVFGTVADHDELRVVTSQIASTLRIHGE
jgi:biotin carboxylase